MFAIRMGTSSMVGHLRQLAVGAPRRAPACPLPRSSPIRGARRSADRYMTPMERILSSRKQLINTRFLERVKIVGVSFDHRQTAVEALVPGQAVAFEHEPTNPHDPNAVAVSTLDGTSLGYVPKKETASFVHTLCFGKIVSKGLTDAGLWGASAEVRPGLPPATVLPTPKALHGKIRISQLLAGHAWDSAKAEILQQFEGKCWISGAGTSTVAERWEFDEERKLMRLNGFAAAAPEVTAIEHMLESGQDLVKELQLMNEWEEEDVGIYLSQMQRIMEERSQEESWALDLAVLQTLKLEVPEAVKPFVA